MVCCSANANDGTADRVERAAEVCESPLSRRGDQKRLTILGAEDQVNEDAREGLGHN